jgi:hypothetical protein
MADEIKTVSDQEIKKVHPRMYEVGVISFNEDIRWGETGRVDIPYPIKNNILRAIEEAGFSITIQANGEIIINAVKKQLQHDA